MNTLLNTPRLRLEPLDQKHVSTEYVGWLNDKIVNEYLETRGGQTNESVLTYINELKSQNAYSWAIIFKKDNKHIGNIKIHPINYKHSHGEYGILIGDKNYWGLGIAKEASLEVIRFIFSNDIIHRITLGVLQNNIRAVKLYKRIGFKPEGVLIDHLRYDDQFYNVIRMAILKRDFNE